MEVNYNYHKKFPESFEALKKGFMALTILYVED